MRSSDLRHPRLLSLSAIIAERLTLPPWQSELIATGIMERLFAWAVDFADDGDLGRYSPMQIAIGIGWQSDGPALVDALTRSGCLFRQGDQLILAGFSESAPTFIHKRLARRGGTFADGITPQRKAAPKSKPELKSGPESGPDDKPPLRSGPTRKEKNRTEQNRMEREAPIAAAFVFALKAKGKTWSPPVSLVESLKQDFPSVDIEAELREAEAKVSRLSPTERRTAGRMTEYLRRWMKNIARDIADGKHKPTRKQAHLIPEDRPMEEWTAGLGEPSTTTTGDSHR